MTEVRNPSEKNTWRGEITQEKKIIKDSFLEQKKQAGVLFERALGAKHVLGKKKRLYIQVFPAF